MKSCKFLALCLSVFLVFSCSDDNDNDNVIPSTKNESEKQIEEILNVISEDVELSTFNEALKLINAKTFTEKELTILAYKNQSSKTRSSSDNETLRHIIGGKYSFESLKKEKKIVALSKDTLFISYSETDNIISVNGVKLGKSITADKSIVFVADSVIPLIKEMVIEKEYVFNVKKINANWSTSNLSEDAGVAEDVSVMIYEKGKLLKELKTDSKGVASFSYKKDAQLEYVVKSDSSSMLYNGYLVCGLFTSQKQIDEYPTMPDEFKAVIGGLKFVDINGDGIIDNNDKIERDQLNNLTEESVIYLVGNKYSFPKQEVEENITLDMVYDAYDEVENMWYEIDSNYSTLEARKKITPMTPIVDNLWNKSYETIRKINITLDLKSIDNEERMDLIRFRSNIYFILTQSFGDVPLQVNKTIENIGRTSLKDVQDYILESNEMVFANTAALERFKTTEYQNTILVYRMRKEYNKMLKLAEEAINSGTMGLHANFENNDIEAIRVYLLLTEANNESGKTAAAIQTMNILLNSEGSTPLSLNTTSEQLRSKIQDFYTKSTFYYDRIDEGIQYNNIICWSTNNSWSTYKLLPIPTSAIEKNSNLLQNPGW